MSENESMKGQDQTKYVAAVVIAGTLWGFMGLFRRNLADLGISAGTAAGNASGTGPGGAEDQTAGLVVLFGVRALQYAVFYVLLLSSHELHVIVRSGDSVVYGADHRSGVIGGAVSREIHWKKAHGVASGLFGLLSGVRTWQ